MKNENIHSGHRSRMRDRVNKEGLDNFQEHEVLEYALSFVIPYKDTNPIAHALIKKFGSLVGVLEADPNEVKTVTGMGEVSSQFLISILQIYNYYEKKKMNKVSTINRPEDTYEFIHRYYKGKLNEELYLISLTPNNHIIRCEKVVEGTGAQAKVTIRKITDMMSRNRVNNVIITHNHPNGSAVPSYEDDQITQALVASLAINDSFLLDHLIVGDDGFYSYRRAGKIESYKNKIKDFLTNRIAQNEAPYEVDYDQE